MDQTGTVSAYSSEEIRLLREQLAEARTEARTYQRELASTQEKVTALQTQLQTVKLEAEVDKLRAIEQVRQQSDDERHFLRLDREKECGRLTEANNQLQTENQELRDKIVILKKRLVEAPKDPSSEPEPVVTEPDVGDLARCGADHRVDTGHLSNAGLQPVEEVNESVLSFVPLPLEEELAISTPSTNNEQLQSSPADDDSTTEDTSSAVIAE